MDFRSSAIITVALFTLLLSGCVLGPLQNHETARTVGANNHELSGGLGRVGYALKWNYGITENLDIGLQYESMSFGGRVKYAFINNSEGGFSLAAALGVGSGGMNSHTYVDLNSSYLNGSWEPYGSFRFVSVKVDPVDLRDSETGKTFLTTPEANFTYGQVFVGTRYWLDMNSYLSGEISTLVSTDADTKISSQGIASFAYGYRW